MKERQLYDPEIAALTHQGCFSSDWSLIRVPEDFSTEYVRNVEFHGEVRIGKLGSPLQTEGSRGKRSGLYNSRIMNCAFGDGVLIEDVRTLRNYRVMDGAIVEDVHELSVTGQSSFGNGTEVEVLNEGGGREFRLFDLLTAQLAYILVCYRHDPELIGALNGMIESHVENRTSATGSIGTGTVIRNAGILHNVRIGDHASVTGSSELENGTILSNEQAPTRIGRNVTARNFIIHTGATVDGGAILTHSFIGQGVEMGRQFSADQSLFFANSEAFHGEAVSLFAGPYTVTHHKSTLLIAGLFSFFNAGSGTNQSNHMYKLGPVHQGIVERGSKTGSFAYLLWPSRVGPFSAVMGRHKAGFDAGEFPFSYISEEGEKSFLTPGFNLFTVGTRRDSEKWPRRDRRTDPEKADLIHFDLLNPHVISKVMRGIKILGELYEKASGKQESVLYKGIRIKRLMLRSAQRNYKLALSVFAGEQLVRKLDKPEPFKNLESLRKALSPGRRLPNGGWIDMAGMVAPAEVAEHLFREIKSGSYGNIEEVRSALEHIWRSYGEYTWAWTVGVLSELYDVDVARIEIEELVEIVTLWKKDAIRLNKMILNDAAKEFDTPSMTGFGIDGDETVVENDFKAVRGTPGDNSFVLRIEQEIDEIGKKAAALKQKLEKLP